MVVASIVATTASSSPSTSSGRPDVAFGADSVVVGGDDVNGTDPITIGRVDFIAAELLVLFTAAATVALLLGL